MDSATRTFPTQASHAATGRTISAIASLVRMWEDDTPVDADESDTEFMVGLSGIVGAHALVLHDE